MRTQGPPEALENLVRSIVQARSTSVPMRLGAAGMVLGVLGAIAATHLLDTMLFRVQPYDPLTYATGLVFLNFVIFVACCVPASRAAGIDPLEALRVD